MAEGAALIFFAGVYAFSLFFIILALISFAVDAFGKRNYAVAISVLCVTVLIFFAGFTFAKFLFSF